MTDCRETRPMRQRAPRVGYTLLEVILALALSVILLALLGTAIQLYLRGSNSGREAVEEAALARNLLQMIASDLRGTIRFDPADTSTIEGLASATGAFSGASGEDEGGPGAPGTPGTTEESEDEETTEEDPPPEPGLVGDQYSLQIDVSRLPRIDQYQIGIEGETSQVGETPSDIKTVTYYHRGGVVGDAVTMAKAASQDASGLARRSVDRAVALWAVENGGSDLLAGREELLASEVTSLTFRYFDGTEWAEEWDSELRGDLPVVVEITLGLNMSQGSPVVAPTSVLEASQSNQGEPSLYRLLVRLPLAQPTSSEDALTEGEVGSEE